MPGNKSIANKSKNSTGINVKSYLHGLKNQNVFRYYYLIIIALPVLTSYYFINYAFTANNFLSFPLDDPWIHLTFARNIVEYFSFSYFKDEIVTAGSTSPLYTFIVAAGFLFTKNEMILSYVLGVIFFSSASFYFFKLTEIEFNNKLLLCLLCTLIFIFDPWMNFISLSGMETTLFIFLLLLGAYFYKTKKAIPLGIILGLILWTRPDGLAFVAAVFVDYIFVRFFVKGTDKEKIFTAKELYSIIIIFISISILYFLMNLYLSGSLLPNTYKAKIAYFIDYDSRMKFLTDKVWVYFTMASYKIIILGFIFSILKFIYNIIRRKNNVNSFYIIFIFTFLFIYWLKLPVPNRFGRYMMPLIPFFILVSLCGFTDIISLIRFLIKNSIVIKVVNYIAVASIFFVTLIYFDKSKQYYSEQCEYIYVRQVKTAQWLKKNTNDSDIIATHDIGAIGFYTGRRIVDVAGLISPELNDKLNEDNYSSIMTQYMKDKGVTFTAFLRNWYILVNQSPVYTTPENSKTEIMDVSKFDPPKSRVLSRQANKIYQGAAKLISDKNGRMLVSSMNKIIEIEPEFSIAHYLRAYGNYLQKDYSNYEADLKNSISLYPEFKEAILDYGIYLFNTGKSDEAKEKFLRVLELDSTNKSALSNLNIINDILQSQKNK